MTTYTLEYTSAHVASPAGSSRGWRRKAAAGLLLLLLPLGMISPVAARPAPEGFADLTEQLLPSVVTIRAFSGRSDSPQTEQTLPFNFPFPPGSPFSDLLERFRRYQDPDGEPRQEQPPQGRQRERVAAGSGFVIDSSGVIITNNHVIDNADRIEVSFNGDNKNYEAKLVGTDPGSDIAVLSIDAGRKLPAVAFGDSSALRIGDWVLAVGNPWGLGGSVTAGIVSAMGRDINRDSFVDFIQTDAAINQGNSGGPLFNMNGEVIGINTAIYSRSGGSIGIGFSIPSNQARQIIAELRETGRVQRGWLGVEIQPVSQDIAEAVGLDTATGALVSRVRSGTPAEKAGLQAGDILLRINGRTVEDAADLRRMVAATGPGADVSLTVWRNGRELSLRTRLDVRDESQLAGTENRQSPDGPSAPAGELRLPALGLTVAPLTAEKRRQLEFDPDQTGVVITDVAADSNAARKGLRPDMVITGDILGPVETPDILQEHLARLREENRSVMLLRVWTPSGSSFVPVRLEENTNR